MLIGLACGPSTFCASLPRPPVFAVSVAVDGSLAGDGNVFLLEGVDERRKIHQLHAFPACKYQRILRGVVSKADRSARAHVEIHVALQMNGPGNKFSGGYDHPATLCRMASRNGFLESLCAIGFVVADGAKFRDIEISRRKNRWFDARENPRQQRPRPLAARVESRKAGRGSQSCQQPGSSKCSAAGSKPRGCVQTFYQFASLHRFILVQHTSLARAYL